MQRKNSLTLIVVLLLIGTGVVLIKSNQPNTDTTERKIGVIVPLTGAGSNFGLHYVNGMQMAADEINASGGMNGSTLKISTQDTSLEDSKKSIDAVRYLLNIVHPELFVSVLHPPAATISPILKEAKKPWIYESYTRSPGQGNPYAFKSHFDPLAGCEYLVRYAKDHQSYGKLGAILANIEFSDLCLEGIQEAEPSVKSYRYPIGEKDFRTLLTKANSDQIDTIVFTGFDYEYFGLFQQLSKLGYPMKILCATANECIIDDVIRSSSPDVLNGTIAVDVAPPELEKSDFALRYGKRNPGYHLSELVFAAVGYDTTMIASKAMKNCTSGDSECIVNTLKSLKEYPSILGSRGFDQDRILQMDMRMYEFRDGKWNVLND